MNQIIKYILLGLVISMLSACGGGGGGGGIGVVLAPSGVQKTATISFTAISTASLPVGINGMTLNFILPQGVSVATEAGNPSQIATTALLAGNGVTNVNVFGRYSSDIRKVKLTILDTSGSQTGFRSGEVVRVTCNYNSLLNLNTTNLATLGSLAFTAYGFDPGIGDTVSLADKLLVTPSASIN